MDENRILMTIAARKIVWNLRSRRVHVAEVLFHNPELGLFAVRAEVLEWSGNTTEKLFAATYKIIDGGFYRCCGVMPIPRKEVS